MTVAQTSLVAWRVVWRTDGGKLSFLLVDLDGCQIARDRERLVVRDGSLTLDEYRPQELECVIAWGRVEITRAAMEMLLSRGVPLHLIGRNGRYQGCLAPMGDHMVARRRAQHALESDQSRLIGLARVSMRAELHNVATVMRRWGIHRVDEHLREAIYEVRELLPLLDDVTTLDEIRGLEGKVWALCYAVLKEMLPPELHFTGRRRRPAPDPVNAVLGLLGVITTSTAGSVLRTAGLDPALGLVHGGARGGPALAMDLADIYRPLLCLAPTVMLFTKNVLGPADFAGIGYSATLTRDGLRKALGVYAQTCRREVRRAGSSRPHTYLWHMRQDAERLARAMLNQESEWAPLRVK